MIASLSNIRVILSIESYPVKVTRVTFSNESTESYSQ